MSEEQQAGAGGFFSQAKKASQGLFNKTGSNFGPKIYFDCEGTYVAKIDRLTTGRSKNKKKNAGRPYLAGTLEIVEVHNNRVKEGETSRVQVGTPVSYMTWLPQNFEPEYMSKEDEFNLAEALQMLSAVLTLKAQDEDGNPYLDMAIADQMTQDDGAAVQGRFVGVDVVASEGDNTTFYNPRFFAVEPTEYNDEGEPVKFKRIAGYTPEELQQINAAAAG